MILGPPTDDSTTPGLLPQLSSDAQETKGPQRSCDREEGGRGEGGGVYPGYMLLYCQKHLWSG
jgi:hypothetical protein